MGYYPEILEADTGESDGFGANPLVGVCNRKKIPGKPRLEGSLPGSHPRVRHERLQADLRPICQGGKSSSRVRKAVLQVYETRSPRHAIKAYCERA